MEPTFTATVFLHEPKGISRPAEVACGRAGLKINASDVEALWDYQHLKLSTAGENNQYLLLTPSTPEGPFNSLVVRESAFFDELAPHLPGDEADFLRKFERRRSGSLSRKWRNIALAGLVLVGLLSGAWWVVTHWAVKEIVKRTPISAEVAWGNAMSSIVLKGKKPLMEGPVLDAANKIWERLVASAKPENPGYPLVLHVVQDPMGNAFALPGGHVVLMTGLMKKADSPEELAGVLAHEIQHVLKRHVAARIAQSAGTRLLISSVTGRGRLSDLTLTAQQLGELSYSRQQESEADQEGVRLMAKSGLPPGALAGILRKLENNESGRLPSFFATHPQGIDRLKNLDRAVAKYKADPLRPLDVDWVAVQQSLSGGPPGQ